MNLEVTVPQKVWVNADGGADAVFIPRIDRIGDRPACLKIFKTRAHALRSHRRQTRAWRFDLAPMPGPLVRVTVQGQSTVRFGYVSEQIIAYSLGDEGKAGFPTSRERTELETKLRRRKFAVTDVTCWNVGRRAPGGALLMLDFGDASS